MLIKCGFFCKKIQRILNQLYLVNLLISYKRFIHEKYIQIYLISDSTGETLDRIFMALKAQFKDFKYNINQFSFTRTANQVSQILEKAKNEKFYCSLYNR